MESLTSIDRRGFVPSGGSYFYKEEVESKNGVLIECHNVTTPGWHREGVNGTPLKYLNVPFPDTQLCMMDKLGEKSGFKLRFGKLKEYQRAMSDKRTWLDMRNHIFGDMVFTDEIVSKENGSYAVRDYGGYKTNRGVIDIVP